MVEGGRIDHGHHAGNAIRALEDTMARSQRAVMDLLERVWHPALTAQAREREKLVLIEQAVEAEASDAYIKAIRQNLDALLKDKIVVFTGELDSLFRRTRKVSVLMMPALPSLTLSSVIETVRPAGGGAGVRRGGEARSVASCAAAMSACRSSG